MTWTAAVGVALVALACGLLTRPVLRRLPEPSGEESDPDKVPYAQLATRWTALTVAGLSAASGAVAAWRGDGWLWLPVTSVVVLAVVVDARTTYLPLRLAHAAWALLLPCVGVHAWLAHDPGALLRALVGGLLGGAVMLLAWRFMGVGFGDVRLMTVLGATATAQAWSLGYPALLWGTIVGAVWGVARRVTGRRGHFAYGPGLWAGTLLALALG